MKKHSRYHTGVVLMAILLAFVTGMGQILPNDSPRRHFIKVDVLGPALFMAYWNGKELPWRTSLTYERVLRQLPAWSLTAGFEYMEYEEHFQAIWNYLPPFTPYREWIDGRIAHHQVSLLGGIRWRKSIAGDELHGLVMYVEARMGWSWRWGRKLSSLSNGSCCDHNVREQGLSPRLLGGLQWRLGRMVSLEGFGEVFYQKLMGTGKHRWNLIPGLAIGIAF